ncbi:uncharacterized protein LOC132562303 [Ylistrum balloti]|uniref:uncharacterized protein LOC132562303 n=1 Tax=Ylistrum balloti TaxID=509963 RepID=UPI002905CD87|nr:uncharacterized protein LOC132562303 [Ylistrum balloti]
MNAATNIARGARRLASAFIPQRNPPDQNFLDADVPSINVPTLQPILIPTTRDKVKQKVNKSIKAAVDWVEWLHDADREVVKKAPSKLKALKEKVDALFRKQQMFEIRETRSALRKFTTQYTIDGREGFDAQSFLNTARQNVVNLLRGIRGTKVKLILRCNMEKVNLVSASETIVEPAAFHSNVEINLEGTDADELYDAMVDRVMEAMATFQLRGSNWTFKSIIAIEIHTVAYKPLRGSSYIPTPEALAHPKKGVINVKNDDNRCFLWALARALHPVEPDACRITKMLRMQAEKLNMDGIDYPVSLKTIDHVEKQNPDISINVFGYETSVYPLRISKHVDRVTINLLLISDGEKQHYSVIKDMSRLLSSQTGNHQHKKYYCLRCLNPFYSQESLNKHMEYCYSNEAVKIEMPEEGSTISFGHIHKSMRVPFTVYADFESFIKPVDTCEPCPGKSYTKKYQKHTPSSFCYYIKCFNDGVFSKDPVTYTAKTDDEDVSQIFVEMLEKDIKEIGKIPAKPMIFGENDRKQFQKATKCWICQGEFSKDDKKYKKPKFTPVVFHNLSGYDSHLFVKNLGKTEGNINCIPNNEEKYISFTKEVVVGSYTGKDGKEKDVKHQLKFIDSFKFMASSLDKLSGNLDQDCFSNTSKYYNGKHLDLLMRKGVYPYEYMDSLKRLDETALPRKVAFYSRLSGEEISDDDYEHAQTVWKEFGMKSLRDYHELYNQSDVLLLADVFENFRDVCIKNYDLDPAWYYTAPGLAWDAALKITEVKLELLSDPDMLLMVEKGIRGGISMISNRYGKANNPYMGETFNPHDPAKYIAYLDANNLYGWAMSKPLPTHGFGWMTDSELDSWKNHSCILEVDLEYPKDLHDLHNDYPLAPESLKVHNVEKLIPNLNDKTNYVIHCENLKLYEGLGMKITKIHRGIRFEESAWLKQYIDLNTNLRAEANNEFEKDFFKLMNNSVFGKTMENIRSRVDIRLVNDETKAKKLAAKPNFKHCTIFDENLVAVHMKKTKLKFNKPVYLGMCILDLSKTLMYDFHYNYMETKYGEKAKLLFTDTDSLAYEIQTEDFYKDISGDVAAKFDTSNFPKDHPSGIEVGRNKKVVGMFKDEAGGKIIREFVGLRAKLYSYKLLEGYEEKKCKGVKRSVVRKSISFEDYKKCLFTGEDQLRKMNVIRSHCHDVYTEEINKIALSANDDKRIILQDGMRTLAHGHFKL